jgi:hypothetical protein
MLEGLTPKTKEALCFLMKKATEELSNEDLTVLLDALSDNRWSMNGLSEALSERGFHVTRGVLQRHKNKVCNCAR